MLKDCRPVEPPVVKDSFTGETNIPEIPDSLSGPLAPSPCMDGVNVDEFVDGIMEARGRVSDPIKVGDAVRFVLPGHKHHNTEGTIVLIEGSSERRYSFESNCGHIKGLCTIAELERVDRKAKQETGFQCGPVIDPIKAGDAVRFVSPGHKRHGTEGVLKSIHHGPKNAYFFISDCGQFHRYCTALELERIIKRYREPTLSDLANGPIECEYRDSDEENWRSGFLVHILNGDISFLCVNQEKELSGQWEQCRIEVGEWFI
jgi:hypothetical protein